MGDWVAPQWAVARGFGRVEVLWMRGEARPPCFHPHDLGASVGRTCWRRRIDIRCHTEAPVAVNASSSGLGVRPSAQRTPRGGMRPPGGAGGTLAAPLGPLNGCPPGPPTSFFAHSPVNRPRASSSRSTQISSPVQCHGPSGAGDLSAPGPSNGSLGLGPLWPRRVRGGVINHSFLLQKC